MKSLAEVKDSAMAVISLLLTATAYLVVGQTTPYGPGPCDGDMSTAAWCDTTQPFKTRAAALVANLTIQEKAGLFIATAQPVPRIGWPGYNWWSEALHGVAREYIATSFPQICGLATSWNKTLFHAVGDVIGLEVSLKNVNGTGKKYCWL